MKLLPENVPKISTTHAHAATNARRRAGVASLFGIASNARSTAIIRKHFRMRPRLSTPSNEPCIDAMPVSTSQAFENECARKKIQAKQVRLKTTQILSKAKDLLGPTTRSTTRYAPCSAPQNTNVQLAPCHSPPRS